MPCTSRKVYSGNGRVLKEFITHWAVGFLTVLLQSLSLQFVIVINQISLDDLLEDA
jgi:hypothetical protein